MKNQLKIKAFVIAIIVFVSCDKKEDPTPEKATEAITTAKLIFSSSTFNSFSVIATDPDGPGPKPITYSGPIELKKNGSYKLTLSLINELVDPTDEGYSIGEEIIKEAEEHMFFYGFSEGLFSSPKGNGNLDNRADEVLYEGTDKNKLPFGIVTNWVTSSSNASGKFKIILKHQPDLKSATSTVKDGETDLEVEFDLKIVD